MSIQPQQHPFGKKRTLTRDSEVDEKSSEFRDNVHVDTPVLKSSDRNLIKKSLKKHFLFSQLPSKDFSIIFEKLKLCELLIDEVVYEQGTHGGKFFIVKKGALEVIKDGLVVKKLARGDTFGEMSLLTQSRRSETVQSTSTIQLWSLSRCTFRQALKQIFSLNFDSSREAISKIRFFANAADSQKNALTKFAILHEYKENDLIMSEGDQVELIFIILEGRVKYHVNDENFYFESGEVFGEVPLLTGNPSRFSVFSCANSKLLSIDKASLVSVFGENFREILFKNIAKNSILSDPYLEFLSKEHIIMLVESLEWNQYPVGETVIPAGYDKKSRFSVVCLGEIIAGQSKAKVTSHQVIGLQNFNEREMCEEKYIAGVDTVVGEINAISIEKLLNLEVDTLFQEADSIKVLKKVGIFKYLSLAKLKSLSSKMFIEEYEKKEMIFTYKELANTLYIVKEGSVEIFHEGKLLRTLGKFDIFGERCLSESVRSASARASTRAECWVLEADSLKAVMEDSISLEIDRRKYYQADILLNNLLYVQDINERSNRKMYVALYESHNAYYDIQVISKDSYSTSEQCMSLVQEKQINLQMDHFLIVKLVKTFTDTNNIYFITEHINGVSLRELMKTPLRENYVRFAISCLVTVLEHLHDKNIIYRDLSPENILINSLGYPHLFKFCASKVVKGRTYTNIGSPFYRSPEIILNRGYSKSTDYWSLGVILYELLYDSLPFSIKYTDDPVTAYQKIIDNKLEFAQSQKFILANGLIEKLLINDTIRAQGDDIKTSAWMKKIDWEGLSRPSSQSFFGTKIVPQKIKPMSKRMTLEHYVNENQISMNRAKYRRSNTAVLFRWDKFF